MNYKDKVVYQVWPRSFYDSNGDGIGDIPGIIEKLDYIKELGIDYCWISPVYLSSNKDYGYDVDDYFKINPEFGTMKDMDNLIKKAKDKGLGIIMDLVANHTSDQHKWFQEALKDPQSPYRDYYIFKEGKEGREPNNWIGLFGGSAWQGVPEEENMYYLTTFTPNQCDLNWENEKVRQGIYEIMRFWLDKGIAGFRLDVINTIAKAEGLPDKNPKKRGYQFAKELMINRDESHKYLKEMHKEVLSKYDVVTIGEGLLVDYESCRQYAGEKSKELNMMITFDLHLMDCGPLGKYDFRKLYYWSIPKMKKIIFGWQKDMQEEKYWIANCVSNHDQPRHISRWGNEEEYRIESAKAFAVLNLTLRGTPIIYQGEEIGMTNLKLSQEDWRDFEALNVFNELQTMMHLPAFLAKRVIQKMTRDNARTPMQWTTEKYAGFSTVAPWIKVNPNYQEINVVADLENKQSLIQFYRDLIDLRQTIPAFGEGSFEPALKKHRKMIAYYRHYKTDKYLVLINLSKNLTSFTLEEEGDLELVLKTHYDAYLSTHKQTFKPYEGRIYKVV